MRHFRINISRESRDSRIHITFEINYFRSFCGEKEKVEKFWVAAFCCCCWRFKARSRRFIALRPTFQMLPATFSPGYRLIAIKTISGIFICSIFEKCEIFQDSVSEYFVYVCVCVCVCGINIKL